MKVGYIRVSTEEQNTARQEVLMEQLGVEKVFIEKVSGKDTEREELKKMLAYIREGDTVVVESFSRLARSTKDLLNMVEKFEKKKVMFISQKENVDTTTPNGKFMLTIFGAMAELERENILQRQKEGIAEAKKAGKYKGRKPVAVDEEKFTEQYAMWKRGETTPKCMQKVLNLKPATFWRKVKAYEIKHGIIKE